MLEDRVVELGRPCAERIRERRDLEALVAQDLDRWQHLVIEVCGEAVLLDVIRRAQVQHRVCGDIVTLGRELVELGVMLGSQRAVAAHEERHVRAVLGEHRAQLAPLRDERVVERQRDAGAGTSTRREVSVRHERQPAIPSAREHVLDRGDRDGLARFVCVQLDDLAAIGGAIECGVDAREAVIGPRIEVRATVHLAAITVVEDAVDVLEIVVAARSEKRRRDRVACYRRAVARWSIRAIRRRVFAVAMLVAVVPAVRADPTDFVVRPLVLRRGELEANLTIEANLKARSVGKPLTIAPDLWIGVTPRLTLGLIHGERSLDQIDAGGSFCVRGNALACDRTYRGSGLDARWSAVDGRFAVAPRVRLLLRDLEPAKPAVTLGSLVRWQRGRFAVVSDPYLRLGLKNRDQGNRAALVLPVWFQVQPTCKWLLALHAGWQSDLAVAKDGWHAPLGIVVGVHPTYALELALEVGFPSLFGPQNEFADRAALVTVSWRTNRANSAKAEPSSVTHE